MKPSPIRLLIVCLLVAPISPRAALCKKPKASPPAARCTQDASAPALMTAVFAKLRGRTLSAKFCQLYTDKVLGARPEECGALLTHPDGRVRFDYSAPQRKTFVFDGKRAMFVEPDAAQVTYVDGFGASPMAQAMAVMWGQGAWEKVFSTHGKPSAGHNAQERLIILEASEAKEQIERIEVVVGLGSCEVLRSVLVDRLGNTTRYRVFDKKFDVALGPDAFGYDVPSSYSVLEAPRG